jgi:hypothetical protein
MKNIFYIFICVLFLFSCGESISNKDSETVKEVTEKKLIGFSLTTKNTKLTSESGTNVDVSNMIVADVVKGSIIRFDYKNMDFTLDNTQEGALNFYSNNMELYCIANSEISTISMPPNSMGPTDYFNGDTIVIKEMTLITIDSVKFVINNFQYKSE